MTGESSKKFEKWRDELIEILGNVEAKIDFPEEDISDDIYKQIKTKIEKIKNEIKKVLETTKLEK